MLQTSFHCWDHIILCWKSLKCLNWVLRSSINIPIVIPGYCSIFPTCFFSMTWPLAILSSALISKLFSNTQLKIHFSHKTVLIFIKANGALRPFSEISVHTCFQLDQCTLFPAQNEVRDLLCTIMWAWSCIINWLFFSQITSKVEITTHMLSFSPQLTCIDINIKLSHKHISCGSQIKSM